MVDTTFRAAHPLLFDAAGETEGTDSTGARRSTPTCTVAASIAGGFPLAAHLAAVLDLGPTNPADGPRTDVILGYPALSQADWDLDFPARRWSARRPVDAVRVPRADVGARGSGGTT